MKKHLFTLLMLVVATPCFALDVIWDRSGAGDSSRYGYTILPLGDQNNDGYADWAIFALGGIGDAPMIEFFHGGHPMPTQPYMVQHLISGDVEGAIRGVGVIGDVNRDGYQDWYIRTLGPIISPVPTVYYFYFGGPAADTIPAFSMTMNGPDYIYPIGNFNRDGFDDIYWYRDLPRNYGQIIYGGSPVDTIPDWTIHNNDGSWWQPLPWGYGDLNGDGYSDWVSVYTSNNTTYIFLGGANPDTVPAYTWPDMAHWPRGIVKDLNGDQYDDLIYTYLGAADVHFGGGIMSPVASAALNFPCEGGANEVVSAGDFNHDGYNDLLMLTDYCAENEFGVLTIHLGHPSLNADPAITIEGWTDPLNLIGIWTAAGLGDVNGDGVDDIAIGAVNDIAYLGWRGRCVILGGDTTLRVDAAEPFILPPASFSLFCYPNPFNATTTISFTLPKTGSVDLNVYDVTGRLVRRLAGGHMGPPLQAGTHDIGFDGSNLSSGIYFVRMEAGGISQTKKIVLLK